MGFEGRCSCMGVLVWMKVLELPVGVAEGEKIRREKFDVVLRKN